MTVCDALATTQNEKLGHRDALPLVQAEVGIVFTGETPREF